MNEMSLAVAIIGLVKEMNGWSLASLAAVLFLVPPVLGFFSLRQGLKAIRALEQQTVASDAKTELLFITMSQKYENNVEFVKNYEKLVKNHQALADNLLEIIKENTKAITLSTARIEGMHYQKGNGR